MSDTPRPIAVLICPACGSQLARSLLSCPKCQRLVHADELKRLAADAERLNREGDLAGALQGWRRALEMLPAASRQHAVISAKVAELGRQVDAPRGFTAAQTNRPGVHTEPSRSGSRGAAALTGAGAIGLLVWKFKFVLALLLTKGKLLLLGLTKAGTMLSMLASLGVYWSQWGWKFALGLVLSIYVHEMGHVAALRRCGLPASAPMFIPGLGAFIRLRQTPADPRQDARIGLAGPVWGLAGVFVTWLVATGLTWPSWAAIAHVAAWINLFNLIPVWQLDGSRGFRALTRTQRWLIVAAVAVMWYWTAEGLLFLVLLVAAGRTLFERGPEKPDRAAFLYFIGLVVVLALFSRPGGPSLAL